MIGLAMASEGIRLCASDFCIAAGLQEVSCEENEVVCFFEDLENAYDRVDR